MLDKVRTSDIDSIKAEDIVHTGYNGITCVEAGGPEPGVGCAGRGIIVALGDVVCGGFAMPIREGYAEEIYIISSGELMSLYAANNIAKGIRRFASRGSVRLAGIIGNSRNTPGEKELLKVFAEKLNTHLVAFVPRDRIVNVAENRRQTVLQFAPDCGQADIYKELAETIWNNTELTIPTPLAFEELEELAAHFGTETK